MGPPRNVAGVPVERYGPTRSAAAGGRAGGYPRGGAIISRPQGGRGRGAAPGGAGRPGAGGGGYRAPPRARPPQDPGARKRYPRVAASG